MKKLLELEGLIFSLFHLVGGKKGLLENLYFVLKKSKLQTFLVVHNKCLMEMKLRGY